MGHLQLNCDYFPPSSALSLTQCDSTTVAVAKSRLLSIFTTKSWMIQVITEATFMGSKGLATVTSNSRKSWAHG